jgi:hypothetical protein
VRSVGALAQEIGMEVASFELQCFDGFAETSIVERGARLGDGPIGRLARRPLIAG